MSVRPPPDTFPTDPDALFDVLRDAPDSWLDAAFQYLRGAIDSPEERAGLWGEMASRFEAEAEAMTTYVYETDDDGDGLEPCPMGCGGLTDDVAGGPCKTCWDNTPDDVDDCWECHGEGWRACDDPIQCFAPDHIDIGGDQMHECGDCDGTGTVPRLKKRTNR